MSKNDINYLAYYFPYLLIKCKQLTDLDASGKYLSGIINGNTLLVGGYYQCKAIDEKMIKNGIKFKANYWKITVSCENNNNVSN